MSGRLIWRLKVRYIAVNETVQLVFATIFVFLVVYAIVCDVTTFRIPNMISIALVVLFLPYIAFVGVPEIWMNIAIAAVVFVALFVSFAFGWLGAGDVKFVSAITLWAGPQQGPEFLMAFGLLGGALALFLLILRSAQNTYPILATLPVLSKVCGWARNKILPYGLPIGLAALAVAPSIFAIQLQ